VNEFHDPELERMLGRASGAYPDANVALEAMRGRVRRVKRRRAMAASTAACVLLAGVVALAVRGGNGGNVQPIQPSHTSSSLEVAPTTAETRMSNPGTEMSTPDTEMASDVTVATMATDSGSPGSPGGPGPNSGKGTKGAKDTTTTTSVPAPVQPTTPTEVVTTYSSKGGSVLVQVVNRRLVLVGTSALAGFTVHVNEVSGDRIRVEFTNGGSSYEIQLELSNGHITNSSQNKGP
jgi:hypothetical protein